MLPVFNGLIDAGEDVALGLVGLYLIRNTSRVVQLCQRGKKSNSTFYKWFCQIAGWILLAACGVCLVLQTGTFILDFMNSKH